jgi:hypothetical protein
VRLRNNLKHERSVWDKEKKGFLDQIASLKVKVTALSFQKTAPPEWILEKHQLVEKCTNLQLRVTALEGERGSGLEKSNLKKLEAEKQKLEKKVEALKTKLVEVLHSAATLQSKKVTISSRFTCLLVRGDHRGIETNAVPDNPLRDLRIFTSYSQSRVNALALPPGERVAQWIQIHPLARRMKAQRWTYRNRRKVPGKLHLSKQNHLPGPLEPSGRPL